MFYNKQEDKYRYKYIDSLTTVGNLSNLFSDSKIPYLYYRVAEKIFCKSFLANDLSRGDIALDASKDGIGIGLKTFLRNNNNTFQKIAEFNKDRELYKNRSELETVQIISELRNNRISFAKNLSKVEKSCYHCVIREDSKFSIYEEPMDYINLEAINNIKKKKNSIWFNDGLHEYNFNISKSTLLKRFKTEKSLYEFNVEIFDNPLEKIDQCFKKNKNLLEPKDLVKDTVYLPLYGKGKKVFEKSGLNQWNAGGRDRDPDEIYIPIPAKIHKYSPNFFPARDKPFLLHLPNGDILDAKVCQDNRKALMSNPNKALGKWLLRDVLGLKEGELLTYKKLQLIGIDSIRLDKIDDNNYKINFVSLGSYDNYIANCELEN